MRLCEPSVLMASGKRGDLAVDRWLLDQQRLAAAGLLHFAVGDLGDLQLGGHRLGDALEFAGAVELPEKSRKESKAMRARLNGNDAAGNAGKPEFGQGT